MTCPAAILRGNDICKLRFAHLTSSDLKERTNHRAYHIPQETVGGNDETGFRLVLLYPLHFVHIADSGLDIRMGAAESCEVLLTEQQVRRPIHCFEIQARRYAGMIDIEERVFARGDTIAIRPSRGIESRMRIVLHLPYVADSDRGGQEVIQPSAEICG